MEEWKTIENYPDYMVSSIGRVKSFKNGKEKLLKTSADKDGYLSVTLCKKGKVKRFRVHRLVAQAFIPNLNNLPIINHKNQIVNDNRVENLEWCTVEYNNNYADRNKKVAIASRNKMSGRYGKKSNKSLPVLQYTKDGELVKKWDCITDVERELGIKHQDISKCCKGKQKSAGNYVWKYAIKFKVFDLAIEKVA